MLGGIDGYFATTTINKPVRGGGCSGENQLEQDRLLLLCDEEGSQIKSNSADWSKMRDRLSQTLIQGKSNNDNRVFSIDVADITCITNDKGAYMKAFAGQHEARVRPVYTDNGNAIAVGLRAHTTRSAFLDPIALTVFAGDCGTILSEDKTEQYVQELRESRVECAHEYAFLLRCWRDDSFRPQDFVVASAPDALISAQTHQQQGSVESGRERQVQELSFILKYFMCMIQYEDAHER